MSAFATLQIQAGYVPGTPQNGAIPPIHQTAAYQFASLADATELFALRKSGNLYSRNASPTQQVLEERVAALEGGASAAAVASGQAAVAVTLLALAGRGGHIVAANQLYGGTVDLLHDTFADFGIPVTFVDQDDPDAWRDAIRPETRAVFAESVANPIAQVLDIRLVADIAHEAGVPLVIDNTVGTPYLVRPGEHGADFVVHSATKFLSGHGTSLGGVVVDQGSFDFGAEPERWPQFTAPYPRFGDLVLWERFGIGQSFVPLVKSKYVHDLGPSLSPFNAWQILQGIETLDLRVTRQSATALAVAQHLQRHPAVAAVNHPGLPGNPWHDLAARYLPRGVPSVFSFDLAAPADRAAQEAVARVIDALRVWRLVANIGDARSLVAHPASMTHSHLTAEQLAAAGISPTTIRLSAGLEDPDDLIADLDRALAGI
ncbi:MULTISPECIES: O-acetylhomoserine aminocarboxypropyltransferase/cysteine synthase family protein [Microbacterium]|uniref:O-acetylhomoserine aminocarboxypropyltransferase/cysteine synthase family protein n=1 Tax=Microbacterium TaxID=33882 RepID=UPI00217DB47D|nr:MULTISPECIES: PLP-dependent transferase [Microbacterium]UWF76965.1 O-acetylhomoserine aminocarboxypropyltransferase/cysteine synthase [Microbacterium neungamense]WCM55125.1 O-acetylhomoserine aminocarboxypropyltransferase/cysteine synthase [Microbacterium sp. EF45047]